MATILFIEDEPALRRMIAAELADAGYAVLEAGNGRDGLTSILADRPDLILCDVNMPVMSGYDVLTDLRLNHPDAAEIPFIFLSALADRRDIVAGKRLGADDYLTKPVDVDMLLATVGVRLDQIERLGRKFERERVRLETEWRRLGESERVAREHLTRLLASHVSDTVADELVRQTGVTGGVILRPRQLQATILFCDIDNFTSIAETLPPDALIEWLNGYMEAMVRCVRRHQGMVNKFMGDAVMAVFGAPALRTEEAEMDIDAVAAARCALDMRRELAALNHDGEARGLPAIGMSIGIQTGPVMAGSFGSADRMEYTVVGDTVNTAARLGDFAKTFVDKAEPRAPVKILVGGGAWTRLRGGFSGIAMGPVVLRGKAGAVEAHRLLGPWEAI